MSSKGHTTGMAHEAWEDMLQMITKHLAQSKSVVVHGWRELSLLNFLKMSMLMLFGGQHQICSHRDDNPTKAQDIHQSMTLKKFFKLFHDVTVCRNFLDVKNMNPVPPLWMKPLLHSTTAWDQTVHLRMTHGWNCNLVMHEDGPVTIWSATWTSFDWRLVTHSKFLTYLHHNCCGLATYIVSNTGCKIWAVMQLTKKLL